ncbi:hypothetical protein ACN28S_64975 [Cystobacter fuscus]
MNLRPLLLSLTLLLLATDTARAAGPKEVAVANRSPWPTPIHSAKDFDQASRAENLVFAKVLGELEARSGAEGFPADLGVKQVHTESLRRWLGEVKGTVAANLRAARASCGAKTEVGCAGRSPRPRTSSSWARSSPRSWARSTRTGRRWPSASTAST